MVIEPDLVLSDAAFARLRERIQRQAGIALSGDKRSLVLARLGRVVRRLQFDSFEAYLDYLDGSAEAEDQQDFVNALTTNLTRFFREAHHFEHLVEQVRELIAARPDARRLRIWSAGCSTGQEAYSIGLCLLDELPELAHWDFRVLATDIDTAVLAKAAAGVYPTGELSGLSARQQKMFERTNDGRVRVPRAVMNRIAFKPLNLLSPWPMKGPFDAIFCRNVTIYFDRATQSSIFHRFGEILSPAGMLYVGHSENLRAAETGMRIVGKTVYQRAQKQKARGAA
jgi:chemotaxis protein methyltransferase CheR